MNLNEIKESGMLELYVLGDLDSVQKAIVERAILDFPSLKQDIYEIESALQIYANAHAVKAPDKVLANILVAIDSQAPTPEKFVPETQVVKETLWAKLLPIASLIGLLGLSFALYLNGNKLDEQKEKYEAEIKECKEQNGAQLQEMAVLESINSAENKVLVADATDKYSDTKLYFNHNPVLRKNYIQIENLPPLAADESYQLWSLKGDDAPRPLNVFQDDITKIFEVSHIVGTDAYAITVETKGGADSPTMANLVAVIKVV